MIKGIFPHNIAEQVVFGGNDSFPKVFLHSQVGNHPSDGVLHTYVLHAVVKNTPIQRHSNQDFHYQNNIKTLLLLTVG